MAQFRRQRAMAAWASHGAWRPMGKQIPIVDYLVLDDGDPHLVAQAV